MEKNYVRQQPIIFLNNGKLTNKLLTVELKLSCNCTDTALLDEIVGKLDISLNFTNSIFFEKTQDYSAFLPLEESGVLQIMVIETINRFSELVLNLITTEISESTVIINSIKVGLE